jgi:signal transduction histidine kinase
LVQYNLQPGLRLFVDRNKLKRSLLNIVVNARQPMPNGGHLRVTTERNRDTLDIAIEDEGEGIPADLLPRIFDSYFTTKSGGSGLGLAIVRRTVEDFGGVVECSSMPGKGTTVAIRLPQSKRPLAPAEPTRAIAAGAGA